jgi:hypothetical protein
MRRAWVFAIVLLACGDDHGNVFDGGDASDDSIFVGDSAPYDGPWDDFPKDPILDSPDGGPGVPPNAQMLFGPAGSGMMGGPCLIEPEIGTMYPKNWLRPRFVYLPPNGANLFEIRITAPNQNNALVVYTAQTKWTMPKSMWDGLRQHSADKDLTITVRSGIYMNGMLTQISVGSNGTVGIAPVDAPGSIVYWTTTGGSALKGFAIGDESVVGVLTPPQVQERPAMCVGCHTSTPDGLFTLVSITPNFFDAIASVEQGKQGTTPPFLSMAASTAFSTTMKGAAATSKAHWANGDHVVVANDNTNLVALDLEAQANPTTTLARTGDAKKACAPTWSHDGSTIVYLSSSGVTDGRPSGGDGDLYSIPYANRMGGQASPLAGASDPMKNEYYPAYAPDDALIAFNSVAAGVNPYNQAQAELYVVPGKGGQPVRLAANDPPACSGKKSPGVTNSWPKWAPDVGNDKGRSFYWLVFSSIRAPAGNPQLYVTPIVISNGMTKTYASLYLWNQPAAENNHTPAWDTFKIPPVPPN